MIKPLAAACGVGAVRLTCAADLMLYGQAYRQGLQRLPANLLAYPHPPINMPQFPPNQVSFWLFEV